MINDITKLLGKNPYPGRGIIIGCSEDGKRSVIVYFIMGRSENSRNRIFEKTEDGIRTAAFDISKMTNPELIIYHPVRKSGGCIIVTNGDQTDTVLEHLNKGSGFHDALRTREFEPDAPNYTPRISGLLKQDGCYILSILKTASGNTNHCQRNFFEYPAVPGFGHFISTYDTDGDPLPSFTGEPIPVKITGSGGLDAYASGIWKSLSEANKVSIYALERDISTGDIKELIFNKHTI